ncbi:probable glutamate receptor [Plutella xylostella]|uniref:probable glutamate receptor n=1 Tax=Plutella xylostella TaxID=51655 RepID=UPI00203283AE|nr:probable glutamate receptor [Plutella xylostella]
MAALAAAAGRGAPRRAALRGRWLVLLPGTLLRRRYSLHNATLVGTFVINQKPRHLSDARYMYSVAARHLDAHPRYTLLVVTYMQDMFHFQLSIFRSEQWAVLRNGSWSGVAGALREGRADVGLAPMAVKAVRLQALEFAGLVAEVELPTVFRQPEVAASPSLSEFTSPLTGAAWAAALPLAAAAVAMLALTATLETIYLGSADNYRANFGDMLLDFVNIFYLDASWRECGLWAGRGAALAAGVLGLLLMQFYSASLLGAVLAPPPRLIASLQDLLRSDLAYKVEDVAYQRQFFKEHMDIPEIAALYNTKILKGPLPPFVDNAVGVKHLMEGNFAFQCTGTYLWHEAARWDDALLCSLDELRVFPRMQQYVSQ